MTVLYDIAPCSLVEIYRRFRGAYYLHQNTQRNIPVDSYLRAHRCENLKS